MFHVQATPNSRESASPRRRAERVALPSGPIRPLERERVTPRDEVRLPTVWIREGGEQTDRVRRDGTWLARDASSALAVDRDAPVLVALHAADSPAWATLFAHAEAGGRAYVLAPLGAPRSEQAARLAACHQVLVRRVPEVFATAVLTADQAQLWLGAEPGGRAPWRLRLDEAQAAALRQVFLRAFWHDAVDEAFSGGSRLAFEPAGPRPFDVPRTNPAAPVALAAPTAKLVIARDGRAHLNGGAPPSSTPRRLWWPASGAHHAGLERLRRAGAEVVGGALVLPDLVVDGTEGAALLPGVGARLRVALSSGQAVELGALLDEPAPWRFEVDARLGDFAPDGPALWLADAPEAAAVRAEEVVAAPTVTAESLRGTPTALPAVWPDSGPLTLAVRHCWTARPPVVPSGASEDGLVGRWRQVDRDFHARVAAVRARLEASEAHQGRLGKVARLVSALVGFGRTQGQLVEEVERLAATPPSHAGVADAPGQLAALSAVEAKVKELDGALRDAERKAREDEERERQEAAWQRRVADAQRELPLRRDDLAKARARRDQVVVERGEVEASEGATTSGESRGKGQTARKAKLSDEAKHLDKSIPRLEGEIARLAEVAASKFVFEPKAAATLMPQRRKGAAFVPGPAAPTATVALPEEQLPEVGALMRHGKQRFLVVARWEEVEVGEHEATRLNARLVAKESS